MKKGQIKPIDAPHYGYLSALIGCFYVRNLYVDVAKRWKGIGFLYLLISIAILSIPYGVKMGYKIGQSFELQMLEPLRELPLIYVQNGELKFDEPMPHFIKNSQGQITTVIDSTGKVTAFTEEYPDLTLLFTKDKLMIRVPTPDLFESVASSVTEDKPLEQAYGKNSNWVFNGAKMADEIGVKSLKYMAQIIIYPELVIIITFILAVIYITIAMMGQVFSVAFFSFSITYLQACRLLVVSGTPMVVLMNGFMFFNNFFSGSGILMFLVLLLYYNFALFAVRSESKKLVRT